MNDMSRVTVEIPTHRLPELYRKLAELCQPENDASLNLTSWEPLDREIASKVYEAMSPDAQAIYDMLFETEQGFTVEELAEKAGKKASQIRGALSWPATHAKNYNKVPIHSQAPDGKVFVPADVAAIFLTALGRKTPASIKSSETDTRTIHLTGKTKKFSGMRQKAWQSLSESDGMSVSAFYAICNAIFPPKQNAGPHLLFKIYVPKGLVTVT